MKSCEKRLWPLILLLTAGLLYAVFFLVPPAEGLGNLVRIAFFHIPVAWVSVLAFLVSAWYALRYLRRPGGRFDAISADSARLAHLCRTRDAERRRLLEADLGRVLELGSKADDNLRAAAHLRGVSDAALGDRGRAAPRTRLGHLRAVLVFDRPVPRLHHPRFYFSLHPSPVLNGSGSIDMDPVMLRILLLSLLDVTLIYIALLCHRVKCERGASS